MAVIIPESDMLFGEYKDEQVFQIEKSVQYNEKLRSNQTGTCRKKCRKRMVNTISGRIQTYSSR